MSFSNENFEEVFSFVSKKIMWNVIGENVLKGKAVVVENCEQTAQYFESVQTNFNTKDIITSVNKVVIR